MLDERSPHDSVSVGSLSPTEPTLLESAVDPSIADIWIFETLGTATLVLLGCGVVANVALARTKGADGGFLLVNFGWGIGVFAGVYVAYKSGAHINPAVTLGMVASGEGLSLLQVVSYIGAQLLGAFVGAALCWLAYRDHFDHAESDPDSMLAVFSTAPEIRNIRANVITEIIGTFILVFVILAFGKTPSELGPLPVALLVVGIGASLGGPTGYAINPARDIGPRLAHALLPIRGKGPSNWSYAWVPVVAPIIGGVLAGVAARVVGYV